jgi:hypothetical protein
VNVFRAGSDLALPANASPLRPESEGVFSHGGGCVQSIKSPEMNAVSKRHYLISSSVAETFTPHRANRFLVPEVVSRFAHCDPAVTERVKRRERQQRWRANRREKRKAFWTRMGWLLFATGDPEAARLLHIRRLSLARNRCMENLGFYNLGRARAAKAAKRAEAARRHEVEIWSHSTC